MVGMNNKTTLSLQERFDAILDYIDIIRGKDSRVHIVQYDNKGNVVVDEYGKSVRTLLREHKNGECDYLCAHCFDEVLRWAEYISKRPNHHAN